MSYLCKGIKRRACDITNLVSETFIEHSTLQEKQLCEGLLPLSDRSTVFDE